VTIDIAEVRMEAVDIIYRLRKLGKTQSDLARDLSVSAAVVNNVIHNRATCHAVATHIAGLLALSLDELWPGRYVFKPRSKLH
jgi:Ner family transcriptional regulator